MRPNGWLLAEFSAKTKTLAFRTLAETKEKTHSFRTISSRLWARVEGERPRQQQLFLKEMGMQMAPLTICGAAAAPMC